MIPVAIGGKYIIRAELLKDPKLTMYSRPRPLQLAAVVGTSLKCLDCGFKHSRGCLWCLGCWEALTWAGVNNRQALLRDDTERVRELKDRYGLNSQDFDAVIRLPGSAVNTLPPWRLPRAPGAEPKLRAPWHTSDRPHKAAPPKAPPPALAATRWQPTIATARSVGKGKAPPPTLTRVPECAQLSNEKIRKLTKAARTEGDFASHTYRYRRDATYAARCKAVEAHPTPECLQYTSLDCAREDGEDVNPLSVHSNASSSSRGGRLSAPQGAFFVIVSF